MLTVYYQAMVGSSTTKQLCFAVEETAEYFYAGPNAPWTNRYSTWPELEKKVGNFGPKKIIKNPQSQIVPWVM